MAEVVKVIPLTVWARSAVKEHGNIFFLLRREHDRIFVESLLKTWRKVTWLGSFRVGLDAEEQIIVDRVTCPNCGERVSVRELRDHLKQCAWDKP